MLLFPQSKINLGLDIIAKRPDGYHDLSTVMVPIPWTDILEMVPGRGRETTLTLSGRPVDCPVEKNLVMRACRLMEAECGIGAVDLYLRKIVPDGAGLGGGSADAAVTLTGLNSLFGLGLPKETLAGMAARLGADCPLFVYSEPMLATGTGTELSPIQLSLKGLHLLVVKPPESVPTAVAYSRVKPQVPSEPIPEILADPIETWQGRLKNDFEPSVFAAIPRLADIKAKIRGLGAVYTSMSGSGSAMFGLFRGDILAERVTDLFPDCQTFTATL